MEQASADCGELAALKGNSSSDGKMNNSEEEVSKLKKENKLLQERLELLQHRSSGDFFFDAVLEE